MSASFTTVELPIHQNDYGRLIGKGGATVKQMKADTGCDVNIDTEKGVARLRGSPASVAKARQMIEAISGVVEGGAVMRDLDERLLGYLTRGGWLQNQEERLRVQTKLNRKNLSIVALDGRQQTAESFKRMLEERIAYLTEIHEEEIRCDTFVLQKINADVGLQQLITTHSLMITSKKDEKGPFLLAKGQRGAVEEAVDSIKLLSEGSGSRDFLPIIATLFSDCAPQKMEDFMSDVDENIRQRFNVSVELRPGSTKAVIEGNPQDVAVAKEELEQLLQYYFADNCVSMPVPLSAVEFVCGHDDRNISRLQSMDLCTAIDKAAGRLWICGSVVAADRVYRRYEKDLENWKDCNIEIPLKERRFAGWLIGPRGLTINKLQAESGATISVTDNVCHIKGETKELAEAGKKAVESFLLKEQQQQQQQRHSSSYGGNPSQQQFPPTPYARGGYRGGAGGGQRPQQQTESSRSGGFSGRGGWGRN